MKRAVVTLAVGDDYKALGELTHPEMEAYADRIGADFHIISKKKYPIPHFDKLQLREYLGCNDRVIFLDTDVLVRYNCPDLFEIVTEGRIGGYNECEHNLGWRDKMERYAKKLNVPPAPWRKIYLNTGVLVLDAQHAGIFVDPPKFVHDAVFEQSYLNLNIQKLGHTVQCLPKSVNQMNFNNPTKDKLRDSYVLHYAGLPVAKRLKQIKHDLLIWRQSEEPEQAIIESYKQQPVS